MLAHSGVTVGGPVETERVSVLRLGWTSPRLVNNTKDRVRTFRDAPKDED